MINEERRSFLRWAIYGLSALFSAVLGLPALAYLADPRNRPAPKRGYRRVEGVTYQDLAASSTPKQGVIRDVRRDAWTLSEDVIGRVWVMLEGNQLKAFTTICPHLGCSINMDAPGTDGKPHGFTCPCHGGKFHMDGSLDTQVAQNPAPRGMDSLDCRRDPTNPNMIEVVYKNFYPGRHEQVQKA